MNPLKNFKQWSDFNIAEGTSFHGVTVTVDGPKFIALFGIGEAGDKVSNELLFIDEDGQPFTVYDWKKTSVYDESLPSPDEFWSGRVTLNIGHYKKDTDTARKLARELEWACA